jgi:hypothetical protein
VEIMKPRGGKYAVTGALAAARLAPHAPVRLAMSYAEDPAWIAQNWALVEADAGENVLIARAPDLLVPEGVAGGSGRRGVSLPRHDGHAMRRVRGLEGALVDNAIHDLAAVDRVARVRVAGPSALIVSKAHKLHEGLATPRRLLPRDAHDIYRLLAAVETAPLALAMKTLISTPLSAEVSSEALHHLAELFAAPRSVGSELAGRAEAEIGQPETVAVASSALANDLLSACR